MVMHAEGSGTRDELFIAGGSPQRINQINRNNQSQIINQYVNQSNQSQNWGRNNQSVLYIILRSRRICDNQQ